MPRPQALARCLWEEGPLGGRDSEKKEQELEGPCERNSVFSCAQTSAAVLPVSLVDLSWAKFGAYAGNKANITVLMEHPCLKSKRLKQ